MRNLQQIGGNKKKRKRKGRKSLRQWDLRTLVHLSRLVTVELGLEIKGMAALGILLTLETRPRSQWRCKLKSHKKKLKLKMVVTTMGPITSSIVAMTLSNLHRNNQLKFLLPNPNSLRHAP